MWKLPDTLATPHDFQSRQISLLFTLSDFQSCSYCASHATWLISNRQSVMYYTFFDYFNVVSQESCFVILPWWADLNITICMRLDQLCNWKRGFLWVLKFEGQTCEHFSQINLLYILGSIVGVFTCNNESFWIHKRFDPSLCLDFFTRLLSFVNNGSIRRVSCNQSHRSAPTVSRGTLSMKN